MTPVSFAIAGDIERLLSALKRSVVGLRNRSGFGAGFVIGSGLVLTNNHVVHGGRVGVEFHDGSTREGRLLARSKQSDLALVQTNTSGAPALEFRTGEARIGEIVIAIGHPLGLKEAASVGMVFGATGDHLKADIRLAPGNSGGPIVDANGVVLGVASMVVSPGIAYCVPSQEAGRFLEAARERGVVAA